jgi:peptidyl-prolyl cis-trans isomerase A (cyclophilin A)
MFKLSLTVLLAVVAFSMVAMKSSAATTKKKTEPGLYAILQTSMGTIVMKLFEKESPNTVANFVGLAEGTKEWTEPESGKKVKRPFYDGLIFHRVIPDFMIQGGDPGAPTHGPGYQFDNEDSGLLFDRPGRLAMANAGRNTNGSQFFITHRETPHLNHGYTIFGQVVNGQEVVTAIGGVPRDANDRPLKPVSIIKLTITRDPESVLKSKPAKGKGKKKGSK